MVNVHGGEMDTSSLDQENSSNTGEVDDEEDDGEDDDDDDTESMYDPQSVTVPLTICFAIMVG